MITINEIALTKEQRNMINEKFAYLAAIGKLNEFSREEIFNFYTGKGGLHDLDFKSFESFHDYTKAKQEIEMGAFFTPDSLFKTIHEQIKIKDKYTVADLTFGKGGFFNGIKFEKNIYGCELDNLNYQIGTTLFPKANLLKKDIRFFEINVKMDLVFGNPPFNLKWKYQGEDVSSQSVYVKKSYEILKQNGVLVLLVPQYYLIDEMMHKKDREEIEKNFKLVCQYKLPDNTFSKVGVSCFETKIMFFQKIISSDGVVNKNEYNSFIDFPQDSEVFYREFIEPLYKELDSGKSKLLNNQEDSKYGFESKVRKLLFDIARNPKTAEFYAESFAYYEQYLTQEKPEKMEYKEWEKIRLTEKKVFRFLKTRLARQNPKKIHPVGTLIKGHHCLKKVRVKDSTIDINQLVSTNGYYPYEDEKYLPLILKKRAWLKKQMQPYGEMCLDKKILNFLKEVKLKGFDNNKIVDITLDTISPRAKGLKFEVIKSVLFNNYNVRTFNFEDYRYSVQLIDTNKILQKDYSYLQWEQGSGKTVSGIAQIKYRKEFNSVYKTIIVGPAIAIEGTWTNMLKTNDLQNLNIKTMKDVNQIIDSSIDTVTINFYYLNKYKKQIKKLLKGKRIFFILDEGDGCSNPDSIRTKAVLDVFRKSNYKCIMSGTSIRNNIPEFFPQMELLYNNTALMMDKCRFIYKEDPKTKELKMEINSNVDYPFKPFKKGHTEFKRCFNPSRVTVFGEGRQNQEIYNPEELIRILDYTVITRTFEEVTGKKLYKVEPLHLEANSEEKALEESIKTEIYKYYGTYIQTTGNARKDAILRIMHQLRLLFKACSNPKQFGEYKLESFTKYEMVKEYLKQKEDYFVVAGTELDEVYRYKSLIARDFPEKKIFYIDGSVSMKKRKEIIDEMGQTKNSVLICTQQSLSSSISINFIDKILLTSLDWNLSKMSQFYFRFIRYNSKNFKNVNILTLKGSIESNLLKLVIDKDSLVSFMKTKKITKSNKLEVNLELLLSFIIDRKELKTINKDDIAA